MTAYPVRYRCSRSRPAATSAYHAVVPSVVRRDDVRVTSRTRPSVADGVPLAQAEEEIRHLYRIETLMSPEARAVRATLTLEPLHVPLISRLRTGPRSWDSECRFLGEPF
jgi:hypothetical protein